VLPPVPPRGTRHNETRRERRLAAESRADPYARRRWPWIAGAIGLEGTDRSVEGRQRPAAAPGAGVAFFGIGSPTTNHSRSAAASSNNGSAHTNHMTHSKINRVTAATCSMPAISCCWPMRIRLFKAR